MAGFATIAALDEHSFVYGCLHDVAAAAPAAAPAASGGAVPAKLVDECKKAGEAVAAAKKSGASKDEVAAKVEKLLALKKQITALDPTHSLAIVDKKKKAKAPEPAGEKKGLSKREQKRLARGEDVKKKKKDKDPNRWAVDPAKAAAKAEKARLKALAKAEAEKADVKAIAPPTPKGDKKILAEQMSRTYNPGDVEAAWQDWWEKSGWYGCDEKQALKRPADEKFVMVIPPVWKSSSSALQFLVWRGRSEVLLAPRGRVHQRHVVSEFGPKPGPRRRDSEGRVASMAWR